MPPRLPFPRRRAARLAWAATVPLLVATAAPGSGPPARARELPGARVLACPATTPDLVEAPPPVAREFRAAWISPVDGGEWPSRPGLAPEAQQQELRAAFDRAAAVGLNAVILHVRPAADALYPTARAPWSSYLGAAPGYDPLAFALHEAHARGLQLHVWFNPFRAAPPDGKPATGAQAIAREHPEWVVRYGSQRWIDPGIPAARQAVLEAIYEVVEKYDVDGVHLDDYFYPYQETSTTRRRVGRGRRRRTVVTTRTLDFPDAASWRRWGAGAGWDDRDAWRRENVSSFVAELYRGVKARRASVLVGISPFGIWRPGAPNGVSGLDAYREIYADSRRWWREGWMDYLAPQLYWALDGEQRRFLRLDAWWRQENVQGRHLWPGLLSMRVASRGAPWPATEIEAQIARLRAARESLPETLGHVHFRLATLKPDAPGALGDALARTVYTAPAIPPASPWLGAAVPAAPQLTAVCPTDGADAPAASVTLAPGDATPVRWWLVQLRDASGGWHARTIAGTVSTFDPRLPDGTLATTVSVAALSPSGMEGQPAVVALR